jgi:hypothetical protein
VRSAECEVRNAKCEALNAKRAIRPFPRQLSLHRNFSNSATFIGRHEVFYCSLTCSFPRNVVSGARRSFVVLALLTATIGRVRAQEAPSTASSPDSASHPFQTDSLQIALRSASAPAWYSMFTNIPGDWVRFGRYAFTEEKIPAIAGIALLTGALVALDERTWQSSDQWYNGSDQVRRTSDFFEYLGDGRPQFGLAAGFAVWGLAAHDNRALNTASQTIEAIFSCGIVVQVLKHVTGRESPFVSTRPGGRWDYLPNQIEYHKHVPKYDAYPSGHIATAMTTVTVVAENYPEWTWVRPVGYVIVGAIGISMANTGIHWYSDYPLGIALGYSFGMLVSHPDAFTTHGDGASQGLGISVAPLLGIRETGILLSVSF